ncbi:phospho-sugar mutase [Janibacter sp. GXQ6167]|uniref:phospho-sugar mutase n=1 Tax=Janibacter sp. GXQ6167 TaxID=3240791 RepID=UPI00352442CF
MPTPAALDDLTATARLWASDDPDETTRAELTAVIEAAEGGDAQAVADLEDRFSGMLQFGTAGLRGALGAGPNRMNRAVVIRAAAGLTAHLQKDIPEPIVVIGYDARHGSADFARDTAGVVTAAGGRAMLLPRTLPTSLLAFAVRHLRADAGVMVTASHNPPQDNGYKVYLGDGSQIVSPADVEIAAEIAKVESVASVPRAHAGWEVLSEDIVEAYLDGVTQVIDPHSAREVSIVHTAMHGVGTQTLLAAFDRAGFPAPETVAAQAEPDPDFPTVAFPNPEEDGALDLALAQASESGADLLIANDPDADRCAAAVRDRDGGWRLLSGDELGVLLGSRIIVGGVEPDESLACSIVSSRLLAAMSAAVGVNHVETLTGFKWIARVPGLRFGYEEALGYCVDPRRVKDKDGISAALLIAELVAILKAQGRSVLDVLDDLHRQYGAHASGSFSVRVDQLEQIETVMRRLRENPPQQIAGVDVAQFDDLNEGGALPPTDGLRWYLVDGSRVIVRPSGTEPKVKIYLEAIEYVRDEGLDHARWIAGERLGRLREAMAELTALDGR